MIAVWDHDLLDTLTCQCNNQYTLFVSPYLSLSRLHTHTHTHAHTEVCLSNTAAKLLIGSSFTLSQGRRCSLFRKWREILTQRSAAIVQRLKKHINLARLVSRLALSSFKKGLVHVTFESITLLCHHQTHLLVTSKEKKKNMLCLFWSN